MANSKSLSAKGSLEQRMKLASPTCDDIVLRYKGPEPQVVALRDETYQAFDEYNLWYLATFNPMQVGVEPRNRSSSGVEGQDFVGKLKVFSKGGVSFLELKKACAVERPPGKRGEEMEMYNKTLAEKSGGFMVISS